MSSQKSRSVAYISGAITGRRNYRQKFKDMEYELRGLGHVVLNPAELPEGMAYERYMPICLAMVAAADVVYVLPGSEQSKGTAAEVAFARSIGKAVVQL